MVEQNERKTEEGVPTLSLPQFGICNCPLLAASHLWVTEQLSNLNKEHRVVLPNSAIRQLSFSHHAQ